MKFFLGYRIWLLLVAGLCACGPRAEAQGFGFSATASTNQVVGTNAITYRLTLTNLTDLRLTNVLVTNTFSAVVTLISVTNSQGSNSIDSGSLVFSLGTITNGDSAHMALTVRPTTAGWLTNAITVGANGTTNSAATNLVTRIFIAQADLGVVMTGPIQAIITNDLTAYTVTVTNSGPGAAPNVVLTNTLPPGVILKGASQSYTASGSNQIFTLGTLASGGHVNLHLSIQPTNAGVLPFTAAVGAPDLLDPNLTNNLASTNLTVITYLPGLLVADTNSAQILNPQNGLMEQSILVSNLGTNDVPAVRIVVTGLTKQLFNVVGTNNGSPFVVYSTTLAAGHQVTLLLQYLNPARVPFPFTNGQLHAFAVPVPDWTPPPATVTSTNLNLSRIVRLASGNLLLEFPTTLGRSYTVVYSDNARFSNAMIAPPAIVAPANRSQWIDYGPPTTVSAVTNTPARFYRVFQNP